MVLPKSLSVGKTSAGSVELGLPQAPVADFRRRLIFEDRSE